MFVLTMAVCALAACGGQSGDTSTGPAVTGGGDSVSEGGSATPATVAATVSGRACIASCSTAADCPKANPGFSYTCEQGLCKQIWCNASADCGRIPGLGECIDNGFARQCMPPSCNNQPCADSKPCQTIFPGYKGCMDGPASCTGDNECAPPYFTPGHTKCQDGYCGCESDAACQAAKGPLLGGTWKCVSWPGTWTRL